MPVEAYEYRIQEIRRRIKELDSVMTDDVNKFEKILQEQVRLTIEGEALLIVKKVISEVFVRIVMRTPVDTGRARAYGNSASERHHRGLLRTKSIPNSKIKKFQKLRCGRLSLLLLRKYR